jgi:hypothetical protein
MENKKEVQSENIVLREGLEISPKITVLSWDRVSLIYAKFQREEIGELQLTLEIIKILLIDKTKVSEIDDMLNGELTEEFIEELTTWGEKIMGLVM